MKKKTVLVMIVMIGWAHVGCAQVITSFKGFQIEEKALIFQRIFDTTAQIDHAKEFYSQHPIIKNVQFFEDYITGEFVNEVLDYRKYGRKWGTTPVLFNNYSFSGKVKIEFKPDKYRLTVYGVKVVPRIRSMYSAETDLSSDALKPNHETIRPSWAKDDMLGLFDLYFTDFRIKQQSKKEW